MKLFPDGTFLLTKHFPENGVSIVGYSPILGNSFTARDVISFAGTMERLAREVNVSLPGKAFLHKKVQNAISDYMRGSKNRETLPQRAQNGKLFSVEYPLILKNIHP